MAESRLIQKQLAGKEDLLLGVGTVSQARATGVKTITKLNATHFGGVLVVDTINDLNSLDKNQLDELAVLVKEDGNTYIYNGTSWVTKTTTIVETIEGLKTLSAGTINVLGYHTKGDNGGGLFYWDSTSTEADNSGTIIQAVGITTGRWKRSNIDDLEPIHFGISGTKIAKNSLNYIDYSYPSNYLLIGDSILEGSGTDFYNGVGFRINNSLMLNAQARFSIDNGYENPSFLNIQSFLQLYGSTNGSYITKGIGKTRLLLQANQNAIFNGCRFNYFGIIYNATETTATSLNIYVNNQLSKTINIPSGGSGLVSTNLLDILFQQYIIANDNIKIESVGGKIEIVTFKQYMSSESVSPVGYMGAISGTGLQDWITTNVLDEMAFYLNERPSSMKHLFICLGTNNIYNRGKALTPSEYITKLSSLASEMKNRCSNLKIFITVPPKADETIFPIIKSGYKYEDYAVAIKKYCWENNYGVIDYSVISSEITYADGVHPDKEGCKLMANIFAKEVNIQIKRKSGDNRFANYFPHNWRVLLQDTLKIQNINMLNGWASFSSPTTDAKVKIDELSKTMYLSGLVKPNGSTNTTLGSLPAGFSSVLSRDCYVTIQSSTGPVQLIIDDGLNLVVSNTTAAWYSLENIAISIY